MIRSYFNAFFRLIILSLIIAPFNTFGQIEIQEITGQFENYHEQLASEKVYLHTNRERFTLGDTLYFSAYVLNGKDHSPTYVSGVLYAEFISPTDSIIGSLKLKIDSLGRAYGDFALSDSLDAGQYYLRAYTQYQMNFDQDYFFTKSIKLLPRLEAQRIVEASPDKVPQVKLEFFPEGGELVAGATNIIAFKATDQYGNPLEIEGNIFDDTNKSVASISCVHDGMGIVQLFLEEGKKYTCTYQFADRSFSQPLPRVLPTGYLLHVLNASGRWHTEVSPIKTSIENTFLVLQCRGEILYVIGPQPGAESIRFSLQDTDLPTGIIQLTFFDPLHRAVAERLIYNENPEIQTTLQLSTDKETYAKRANVNLGFNVTGTGGNLPELATLSTTVVPLQLRIAPNSTISSFLFLTSDLKGYVHNPTYYLDPVNPNRLRHIDLLMITHGWRRFEWEPLIAGEVPELNFFFEQGIRIEGTVKSYLDRSKTVSSDLHLTFAENAAFQLETTSLENGLFWFDKLKFTDTLTAYIKTLPESTKKSKKLKTNTFIQIHDRVIPPIQEHYLLPYQITSNDQELINRGEQLFNNYAAMYDKNEISEDLDVSSEEQQNDDPYTGRQGMIYSNPDHRIMLDSFPQYYRDVFQYLYAVPGLVVSGFAPSATVKIRGAESFNSPTGPIYMLDGIERDEGFVNNLNVMNILFIDVLKGPNASVYGSRGATGVIALYSRESGDTRALKDQELAGQAIFKLAGYTPTRKFYMPDYSKPAESNHNRPDFRSTIYWNPLLKLESGKATDQFYTSDETGEFIIYSEGVTVDGKVFSGQTTYEVK